MEKDSDRLFQEISILSKKIFISFFVFFLGAFVLSMAKVGWLASISFAISYILIFISWIAPGSFIIFGKPWLAHAWFRGINPIAISKTPWNQLSGFKKFLIYLNSLVFFIGMIGYAVTVIGS